MPDWVALKRGNDWGSQYISYEPLNERGFADSARAFKPPKGTLLRVEFPNGETGIVEVEWKLFHGGYSDHGKRYDTAYSLPGFTLEYKGLKAWHALDEVKVARGDLHQ